MQMLKAKKGFDNEGTTRRKRCDGRICSRIASRHLRPFPGCYLELRVRCLSSRQFREVASSLAPILAQVTVVSKARAAPSGGV